MTRRGPKRNLAASIRARLSQLARDRHEDFKFVLTRYAMERLLYRLSKSPHEPSFVLKGAMLFAVWSGHPHRATHDLDLLGFGAPDLDRLAQTFRDICLVLVEDDGVAFDPKSVTATRIKEAAQYEGVRVQFRGTLGSAVLNMQVDIGFGDAVTPAPLPAEFPVLLDAAAPKLRVYPRDTVVAEKLEAMIQLGIANSRMKDFFDLSFLARSFEFDGNVLVDAIGATFARRGTPVPKTAPLALTAAFTEDAKKQVQWTAFLKRIGAADQAQTLAAVVAEIHAFVSPPLDAIRNETTFRGTWAQGRWR